MQKIKSMLGIDRAVFFTLVARMWSMSAGLLTIVFVTRFLSPEVQGYYYTFNSLIALQMFVELGLTFVITQFASHEMAQLSWNANDTLTGPAANKRRLQSLIKFALAWFGIAAALMLGVLLPAGIYFFGSAAGAGAPAPDFIGPWVLLVVFSAANLAVTALAAVIEGCGRVAQVALLRLWQSVLSVTAAWVVLGLGGYLYALGASAMVMLLVTMVWLWRGYKNFILDILQKAGEEPGIDWRREIWPFQWRIALSWVSGYLIFQLFNPLLFATHGAVAAGQMGMSLQIIGAMNSAAMAWINTKVPSYGRLVASNQFAALETMFFRGFIQSSVFLVAAIGAVGLMFYYLALTGSPYYARILPLPLFGCLGLVCLANHAVFAQAAYLRAHKEDPFMVLSVSLGVATAALALLLVPPFGAAGAVYAYTATAILIGLAGGTAIFIRKRRLWAARRGAAAYAVAAGEQAGKAY